MDALIPPPSSASAALTAPAPLPSGPVCAACGSDAVVNWQRRPTSPEVTGVQDAEQSRRDEVLLLADPQQPAPQFGPLPTGNDMTRVVYACAVHAITLELAARIHASTCTAPNAATLPGCDCTPEPLPPQDAAQAPAQARALPAHWVTGGA